MLSKAVDFSRKSEETSGRGHAAEGGSLLLLVLSRFITLSTDATLARDSL